MQKTPSDGTFENNPKNSPNSIPGNGEHFFYNEPTVVVLMEMLQTLLSIEMLQLLQITTVLRILQCPR